VRERQQVLAQLGDIHVATLASANPVDVVSTDRHTVKPWFQGKLPFSFNLPELQGTPFTLVGARMAYFEHAPAAQLLFQYQQHRISVFIAQETPQLERELGSASLARQLSFNFEYWESNGLCYVAVGDAEADNIGKLVTLLKQAGAKS
jgi:anti-sigma factor RsiW